MQKKDCRVDEKTPEELAVFAHWEGFLAVEFPDDPPDDLLTIFRKGGYKGLPYCCGSRRAHVNQHLPITVAGVYGHPVGFNGNFFETYGFFDMLSMLQLMLIYRGSTNPNPSAGISKIYKKGAPIRKASFFMKALAGEVASMPALIEDSWDRKPWRARKQILGPRRK